MTERLVYECSSRPFLVPARVSGHRERVGHLDVAEYRRRSKLRPYGLRMECQVSTKEEAWLCHSEALQLASDFNTVWPYVAGVPLFPKRLVLQLAQSPEGWSTNFDKIEPVLPTSAAIVAKGFRIISNPHLVTVPYMPLQRAIAAVHAYRNANENSKLLIDLHLEAMNQLGTQSGLFLLAKALELARAMLPGRDDKQRLAALSPDVHRELRQSLHWLYGIANSRLELRHVINKVNKKDLLPKLNHTERTDFLHDADLTIRGVVEREMGMALVIVK